MNFLAWLEASSVSTWINQSDSVFAAASTVLWLGVIFWGRLMPFLGLTF